MVPSSRRLAFPAAVALAAVVLVVFVWFVAETTSERSDSRALTLSDRIDDEAALLDAQQRHSVAQFHALLLRNHDIDYRVVTTSGPVEINEYGARLFRERSVGGDSESGRGLLLVLDPANDQVRLEVSAALEGVYTDAFAAYLEQRQMVHFFQRGRVADGILAATELIVSRAQEAEAGQAFNPEAMPAFTTGAGAATTARLKQPESARSEVRGAIPVPPEHPERHAEAPGSPAASPLATVSAYLDAMGQRDARSDLDLYTRATRAMLAGWTVTPAQMDNIVKTYRRCPAAQPITRGARTVVRYPPSARHCSPWFLRLEDGRWRLDLTVMKDYIAFNHENQWHFRGAVVPEYRFAFEDWRFDRQGFPRISEAVR